MHFFGLQDGLQGLQEVFIKINIRIINNSFYIYQMEETLIKRVESSGLKKNHLAKLLGIKANHFYQCLSNNRRLSIKKQETLKEILASMPAN